MVFRKVLNKKILSNFIEIIRKEVNEVDGKEELKKFSIILENNIKNIEELTTWLEAKNKNNKDDVSAACNDFLKILGYISLGYVWFKIAKISLNKLNENKDFYSEKINTAKFFYDKIIPRIDSHYNSAKSGSDNIMKANFN